MNATRQGVALFILRAGLGVFLLLWSVDKLVAPQSAVGIYQFFYRLSITTDIAYIIGVAEGLLSLAIIAGFLRTYSYGLGLALHAISTLSTYQQLLHPFGEHHLFIAALPVLAGFVTLFLLRRQDTLWSVDTIRRGA
jgi:putative oxidoreductase